MSLQIVEGGAEDLCNYPFGFMSIHLKYPKSLARRIAGCLIQNIDQNTAQTKKPCQNTACEREGLVESA